MSRLLARRFALFTRVFSRALIVPRAISSMDRPFESDGEAPPPQDDAVASVASSSDASLNNSHHQHHQHHHQQHHYQPHESESLSLFMRGLRDLAARHRVGGGGASQRIIASRLHAAAVAVQVRPFSLHHSACCLLCRRFSTAALLTLFLLQCAWRVRVSRHVALDMLRSLLENQQQQRRHQHQHPHEQQENHRQHASDHFGQRHSHDSSDSPALDASDQVVPPSSSFFFPPSASSFLFLPSSFAPAST